MAFDEKKFVGADALSELSTKVKTELDKKTNKAGSLTNVSYDTTNKKFTKTTQGAHDPVTTDIVSTSTLKTDMGIADFDGTFNSLKSKPTTISGYGITDAKVQNSTVTIGSNSVTALTQDDVSSTYDSSGTSPVDGKAVSAALGTLDVESVGGAGKYISAISETDGKISATAETMDSTPTSNSTKAVTSDGIYEYVNSSVATNTAYFIGTFDSVEELEAYSGIITNNDYAFVTSTDSSGNTLYNRYKYNGSTHTWSFEYALNNSSFTSAQWATIQSGLTSSDKTKLDGIQSGANKTIVDAAMSSSSTNPVQNKVVNTALAGKQDTLTFDSTPTQSSTNPVTSAGIYTDQVRQDALEAQDRAALVELVDGGAKNIRNITLDELKTLGGNSEFTWSGNVATKDNNVTFTINSDGTITVNATQAASAQVIFDIYRVQSDANSMVLSGCPSGGNADTYFQYVKGTAYRDYGEGVLYSRTGAHIIGLVIASGYQPQNLIFRPMICTKAEWDISQAYVPYCKTNAELTTLEQQDRDGLLPVINKGSKNLLYSYKDTAISTDDITVTYNANGSYTFECTSVAENRIISLGQIGNVSSDTYTFSGSTGGSSTTYMLGLYNTSASAVKYQHTNVSEDYTGDVSGFTLRVRVIAGYSGTFTVYPMICTKGEYQIDPTFSEYRKNNEQLTTDTDYLINTGVKNLLHFDAIGSGVSVYGKTYTHNGITYTLNADMTVTATGTADSANNSYAYLILDGSIAPIDDYADGKHIISGCPTNGSTSKYRMYLVRSGWGSLSETGRGAIIPDKGNYTGILIACFVSKGYAIPVGEPLVFKPMIRKATILDPTYEQFSKTNADLTTEADYAVNTGVKNLIPINNLTTSEDSYCSWAVNSDSSITVTPKSAPLSNDWTKFPINNFLLPAGTYIMSGGIAESSTSNSCDTYVADMDVSPAVTIARGWTNGYQTFTLTQPTHIRFAIRIKTSYNSTVPVTFKPMIRSASISDTSYQPYARSNPALTAEMDYVVNAGAKNVLPTTGITSEISGITFAVNADGTITSSGTLASGASSAVFECSNFQIRAGIYTYTCEGAAQQNVRDSYVQKYNGSSWDTVARDYENNTFTITQTEQLRVRLRVYSTGTSGTFKPMIRPAAITDATFQPFSKTNRELTVITDEDRDALVELVDSGAKNLLHFDKVGASGSYSTSLLTNGVRFTVNADGTITANRESSSSSNATVALVLNNTAVDVKNLCDGLHILSGCPSGGAVNTYRLYVAKGAYAVYDTGTGAVLSDTTENTVSVLIVVSKDYNIQNLIFRPMICTTTAWKISQAYQPYRPSWQEMYDRIVALENGNNRALTMQMQPTESTKPEENKELELTKTETEEVKEELKTKEPEVEDTEIKDDISSDLER